MAIFTAWLHLPLFSQNEQWTKLSAAPFLLDSSPFKQMPQNESFFIPTLFLCREVPLLSLKALLIAGPSFTDSLSDDLPSSSLLLCVLELSEFYTQKN